MINADYNIADNLPESLNRENLQQVAQLIDIKMHELNMLSELVSIYPRIDELSSALIDALAIQFHVDFYDTTLPLDKRRSLVKNSVRWHMRKGTKGVVQELVQTVFDSGIVKEWFGYEGEPYHFRVDLLSAPEITPENIDLIVKVVNTVKNVRSWLDGLGFRRETTGVTYYGVAVSLHKKYSIGPAQVRDTNAEGGFFIGGISQLHKKYAIEQASIQDVSLYSPYKAGGGVYLYKKYGIGEES